MESFDEEDENKSSHFITGISGKKNFSIITIAKSRMNDEIGYVRRALEVFERFEIPIEHIPSSIDSFSVVIASKHIENRMHELVAALNDALTPDTIKIDNEISLIAIVGRKLQSNIGIAGKIFTALGENNINIKMIEQGADEINIIIGVNDRNFKDTIKVLYNLSEVNE